MTISSKTPEGGPGHCPLCEAEVRLEPSLWYDDATCPRCGTLLWLIRLNSESLVLRPSKRARQRCIEEVLCDLLGVDREELARYPQRLLDFDSLDIVELVMELEEEAA